MTDVTVLRRAAGSAKRYLFPSPDVAAWRRAVRQAARVPRRTPGEIDLPPYRIAYGDLLTVCPSWRDIFVSRVLAFHSPRPAPRIIDCGANIGLASLFFKREYPRARITAYEADADLAGMCRRNMAANGAADVDVRQAAVWTENGSVAFACEGADAGAIDALGTGVAGVRRHVPSVRLRDVVASEDEIDLLKIDIEGAEFEVIPDCAGVLARVRAMLLDVHEFDPGQRRVPALLDHLQRAGFVYAIDHLMLLPWRGETGAASPFPKVATAWAFLVRAWRP